MHTYKAEICHFLFTLIVFFYLVEYTTKYQLKFYQYLGAIRYIFLYLSQEI